MNLTPVGSFITEPLIIMSHASSETEKQLDVIEKDALEMGKNLPLGKQDLYKAMVRQGVNQIRGQIAAMRSQGKTDYEISRAVKVLVQDFKASNDNFIQKNQIYTNAKNEVLSNFHHTNNSLNSLNSNFSKIKRLDFVYEEEDEDPLALDIMEERKTSYARCLLTSMDMDSPLGAMPCLAHHEKGLTKEQKKELSDFTANAMKGNAINSLASVPALISKVANAAVGGVVKGLALSAMSEAVLMSDPYNYDHLIKEGRRALNGENMEVNQAMVDAMPNWMISTAKTIKNWDEQLNQLDKHMQDKYRTIPGIVHDGIFGTAEIGLMAASVPVVKGTVCMAKGIARIAGTSSQLIRGSFPTFSNAHSLYLDLLKASVVPSLQPAYAFFSQPVLKLFKSIFKVTSLPKTPHLLRNCGKNECAGKFIRDMKEFSSLPNMISEKTKKEMVLVQYHGSGVVGVDRSHNWWMVPNEANYFHTLEEVMNKAGLLTSFGERNFVSVARIPKGEQLTFLSGKAGKQIDAITGEIRPGGATQLRIKDFKAEWIRETKKLPDVEKLEKVASPKVNPFTIVSKDHFHNRQITKRTKMIPEDIGISSLEYLKDKRPFYHSAYHLEGWMTLKKDVFNITLESIEVPKGRLSNWLTVMSNFKEIAKANQAKVLQFEAQIVNEKLLQVMTKYYGEPSIVLKKRYHDLIEYQVFKIPL
ncbi:MAG: hypothetical protein H0W50_02305 [Parachlamydiaceae bacterium]|nr:hypothetical protein [Parachlamydiaceae bacterium]